MKDLTFHTHTHHYPCTCTHLCLHHLHPLSSEISDDGRYVYRVLSVSLLCGDINSDEGTSTPYTSTGGRRREEEIEEIEEKEKM